MPMLDDLLKQSQPGINPNLENMIARLMTSGGAPQGLANASAAGLGGQPQPSSLGTGAASVPGQPGAAAPMAPEMANQTYQVLVQKGVPPQVARQAIANPQLLRQLLQQLYAQGGTVPATGPQEASQAMPNMPGRVSAPPPGGSY